MIGNFKTVIGQDRLLGMMIDRLGIRKIDIRGISDRNQGEWEMILIEVMIKWIEGPWHQIETIFRGIHTHVMIHLIKDLIPHSVTRWDKDKTILQERVL